MGYSTDFNGEVKINKPVDQETYELLVGLAKTRRVKRAELPEKYGIDGEFFCKDREDFGQGEPSEGIIVNGNEPPSTQPSLWLQWLIQNDRQTIMWDEGEKFYKYVDWMKYIVDRILAPRSYICNGEIHWAGEENEDLGMIYIKDNVVTVKEAKITY